MAFTDEFADVLEELEDPELVPGLVTWASNDYSCFVSGATRGGKLEHFGWGVDDDLVVIIRTGLFGDGAKPIKGQQLINQGTTYRIDNVLTAPGTSFIRLACVNASRGA